MADDAVLAAIGEPGVVAIFRTPSVDGVAESCRALRDNGIRAVEITLTIPGALSLLASLMDQLADSLAIGVGTVLDLPSCRAAIDVGASFVVSPGFDPDVVRLCSERGTVSVAGCLTPTEVMTARQAGADVIKLFPGRVADPPYLADLLDPFPDVRLMPTGGVDARRAGEYIHAGAFAVGVGGSLVDVNLVRARDVRAIGRAAAKLLGVVAAARAER